MQLIEIEGSSNVKAAGFEGGVVRVLFHGGHFRDYAGTPDDLAELLKAPSKGRFVRERLTGRPDVKIASGPTVLTPLDTFEDDVCCSPRLSRAIRSGKLAAVDEWTCPVCEVPWVAEVAQGIGRHWSPRTWSSVFR